MNPLCDFLHNLILSGNSLLVTAQQVEDEDNDPFGYNPCILERDYTGWVQSVIQVLSHAELKDYETQVRNGMAESNRKAYTIARITGFLQSARECLQAGFAGKLKRILHAETFENLAHQARHLLETGHRIPAAVLGRVALEDWIRDEAEAVGIPDHKTAKAAVLNDALKTAGKFTQPKWRQIQVHFDVGNKAAHGQDDQFTDDDVKNLLAFVEANCLG